MSLFLIITVVLSLYVVITLVNAKDDKSEVIYIDASGEKVVEKIPGVFWLKWLYRTSAGDLFLEMIIKRKFISQYYGSIMDKEKSKERIDGFIKDFNIDMSQFVEEEYNTFNEFFYRKIKDGARSVDQDTNSIVSPADGKIIILENLDATENYFIKGDKYDLKQHFDGNFDYSKFVGGSAVVVRLAPADYHRFHFPVDGDVSDNIDIEGDYYSVSPIAVIKNIAYFFKNKRTLTKISTANFGEIVYSDIGATMVGSIFQTFKGNSTVKKGDEKGYFAFGGSSVVLFFEKDKVVYDETYLKNSRNGFETQLQMGQPIAYKK